MKDTYLKYVPKTLQEDFVDNRVIPFIGAGFSKNAIAPEGLKILDWNELGRKIATYIPDYTYTNAIDALSLFESEFSRAKLIEILARELNINHLVPGKAHQALCNLYFDTICTTNFDFLIEQTLRDKHIPFSLIVSEERLPINTKEKTKLIKLHGDFNHPEKMVITELDYDTYIDKNKILCTYISNLFITKTLLLIGYSFDDSDIRTLWQIIGSHLGKLRTPAYVILVNASPVEISRFERRSIKVINLPGKKDDYREILAAFFTEIKQLIDEKIPAQMLSTNEKTSEELKMPKSDKRLCFVSTSYRRLSFLKDLLYPTLIENGVSPISLDETFMPGEIVTRKIDVLITESSLAIVDLSERTPPVMWELENLLSKGKFVILIAEENILDDLPLELQRRDIVFLKYNIAQDNSEFLNLLNKQVQKWSQKESTLSKQDDFTRLFEKSEFNAAAIAAFRFLETTISKKYKFPRPATLRKQLYAMSTSDADVDIALGRVKDYIPTRNMIVHTDKSISKDEAEKIISCIKQLCDAINNDKIIIEK